MRLWFGLIFLLPHCLYSQLVWERTVVDNNAEMGEREISAVFPFENKGKHTIQVLQVITSCGCLQAKMSARTIKPGEKGKLEMVFRVEDRLGLQVNTVELRTDPPLPSRQLLTMRTNVRSDVYFDRRMLFWSPERPPTTIPVRVKILAKEPMEITRVESSDPRLRVALYEVRPGNEYRIDVTPVRTNEIFEAELLVTAVDKEGNSSTMPIFAAVR